MAQDIKAMQAELDALRVRNTELEAAAQAKRDGVITIQLGKAQKDPKTGVVTPPKGNVCVYGLQRMPVSLYAGQWERLAKAMPDILAFIQTNSDKVSRK